MLDNAGDHGGYCAPAPPRHREYNPPGRWASGSPRAWYDEGYRDGYSDGTRYGYGVGYGDGDRNVYSRGCGDGRRDDRRAPYGPHRR